MKTKTTFLNALKAGALAAVLALAINALIFLTFQSMGVLNNTIEVQPGASLKLIHIVFSSILPSIVASMVFFLFDKFSNKGLMVFTIVSAGILAFSFISPFGIPNVTTAYALVLNLMHVVVAASVVWSIRRQVRLQNL